MSNIEPTGNMGPGGNSTNSVPAQPRGQVGASSGNAGPGGNSTNQIPIDQIGFNYNPYQTNQWWESAQWRINPADVFMVEDNTGGMGDQYKQYLYDSVRQGWGGDTDLEKQRQGWEITERGLRPWLKERAQAWNVSNGNGPSGPSGGYGKSAEQIAAEAKQKEERTNAAHASIRNQLGVFGIGMAEEGMRDIAVQAVENNWSQDQLQDMLLAANDWATTQNGQLKAGIDEIRQMASQYLMPVSEETARKMSLRVASGELDQAGIRNLFTEQARTEYGFMGSQLDQGITPADFLAPLRDVAAQTLELPADQLDLMDDKVRSMFTTRLDDGTIRAASMSEVQMTARKDSRYSKTQGAQDRIAAMGASLARAFGGQ
jgi:hypothetical protein